MEYRLEQIIDQKRWDQLSITQWQHSFEYGEVQTTSGRKVERYIIIDDQNKTIGFFQLITYPLFRNKTISYAPYGPVFLEKPTNALLRWLHKELYVIGKNNNSIAVRTELPKNNIFNKLPLFAYRTSFHQPRGEMVLDLQKETAFSKSTKRNLKKAKLSHLETSFYHGQELSDNIETFITLNTQNTRDHKTTTHTDHYFRNLFTVLANNQHNFFAVTRNESGTALAANLFVVFNNHAFCPFGASSNQGKQLGAYYQIKADCIEKLQVCNIATFNWGGVSIGLNDDNLSGLNNFKRGFGGETITHDKLYDCVTSWWYWIYLLRALIKK